MRDPDLENKVEPEQGRPLTSTFICPCIHVYLPPTPRGAHANIQAQKPLAYADAILNTF